MTSTCFCRNHLRKQILEFSKGHDLKKGWKIEKKVQYNDKEYPNEIGLKCDADSGRWKMGTQISPDGNGGYYMIHYTIEGGKVSWNAECRFNSKMTCVGGYMNYFGLGNSGFMSGKEMCNDYLKPFLQEVSRDYGGFISKEQGFHFIHK
tara:strand:- start:388 stop:834 length:447 start_codon:yes stop_codon:yes gene_type:complete